MTIQKAIEILQLNVFQDDKKMPPDVKDAVKLAIQALNHCLGYHNSIPAPIDAQLLK